LLRKQRKTLGGYFILPHPVVQELVFILLCFVASLLACKTEHFIVARTRRIYLC